MASSRDDDDEVIAAIVLEETLLKQTSHGGNAIAVKENNEPAGPSCVGHRVRMRDTTIRRRRGWISSSAKISAAGALRLRHNDTQHGVVKGAASCCCCCTAVSFSVVFLKEAKNIPRHVRSR